MDSRFVRIVSALKYVEISLGLKIIVYYYTLMNAIGMASNNI